MSPGRHLVDVRPLRESAAFRRLWLSGVLSGLGGQIAVVAVLFQVWDTTRNPYWVGAIGLFQAVPMVVLGLVGGPLADVLDRRVVGLWSTGAQALAALGLASQLVLGPHPLVVILLLVAAQTGAGALGAPARRTYTTRLLPRALVPAGIALLMIAFQAAMLVGPAVGGILIDVAGVAVCYLVNAVALLVSWTAVRSLPSMRPGRATRPDAAPAPASARSRLLRRVGTAVGMLGEGVVLIARRPVLRGSFLVDLAATLLAFPVALFPMLNEERFGGDPRTLGLFLSSMAVGGLLAGLWSGAVTRAHRLGLVQLGAATVWGMALLAFALSGPVWLALGFLAVAGAADTVSVTTRAAMVQLDTADSHLGRVSAVEHVVGVAGPDLGNLRAGVVAGLTTPAFAAVTGAALCVVGVAVVGLTHRGVRDFRVT
ncbi:MFS transporter [Ornithinimicrobium cerasi]|uniref:MFS transporter n=1 Tax=Ornithinimicrobium cerasi TaxID=2248773 RepID=UPI000F00FBFC|nr:MFS transporter [Ornithinimicrobium cerasi]